MTRWMSTLTRRVTVIGVLGFAAATCVAATISGSVPVHLDGVNASGNSDPSLGADVTGKAFKDVSTGIILQVAYGKVTNQYGAPRIFSDQGLTVTDPQNTSTTYTATNDLEIIGAPMFNYKALNWQIAVYDPTYVPN
jgi:hypothetical protein